MLKDDCDLVKVSRGFHEGPDRGRVVAQAYRDDARFVARKGRTAGQGRRSWPLGQVHRRVGS